MRELIKPVVAPVAVAVAAILAASVARADLPATQPAATPPSVGVITGRVNIDGNWSLAKPDLSRVVVFVAAEPALEDPSEPTTPATCAQKNKSFVPNFLVVRKNTTVEFPNWDDYNHNVFSLSKAAPAFDLDRYPKGQSKSRKFDKAGVVQLFCNIHPKMRAIVYVVPNRFYARAGADGAFTIENVPVGPHHLMAWQERCGETALPVVVAANGTTDVGSVTLQSLRRNVSATEKPTGDGYGVERGLGVKREKLNLPVVTEMHPATQPCCP